MTDNPETSPAIPIQTPEERILAADMAYQAGYLSVRYTVDAAGERRHDVPDLTEADYQNLAVNFPNNERNSLKYMRDSLMAIYDDRRMNDAEKADSLDRFFDAYTNWTINLDQAAFPETHDEEGDPEIGIGIPAYIPDGYVDLRREPTTEPQGRQSEMIRVDKRAIYERYKPLLLEIFSRDYGGMTEEEIDEDMMMELARGVAEQLPIDVDLKDRTGETVDLATLPEGVCRHRNLTYQVLAQAVGLNSRMIKGFYLDPGDKKWHRHSVNAVENHGNWKLVDVTLDDYVPGQGRHHWEPTVIPIDAIPKPLDDGVHFETLRYQGRKPISGKAYAFETDDEAYWTIRHAA